MKNPEVGPILSQAYMRQVLAHLSTRHDDPALHGRLRDPDYGPTPVYPKGNPFVSPAELTNPYPYSVSAPRPC